MPNQLSINFGSNTSRGALYHQSTVPHHGSWLQARLHAGENLNLKTTVRQSFGHPIGEKDDKEFYGVTCPEDLAPVETRMKIQEDLFDELNSPDLTRTQRMTVLDRVSTGFALIVRQGEADEPASIFFISAPVLTRSDPTSEPRLGAPILGDAIEREVAEQLVFDPSQPSHILLGSVNGNTYKVPSDADRNLFARSLLPVLMPDGDALGRKPLNRPDWQILLFPHMSECPVGLMWPVTDGFDTFKAIVESTRGCYKGLLHLLQTREPVIRSWFDSVKSNSSAFAVPVISAYTLWDTFPTLDSPSGSNVKDLSLLNPFREQQERFLRFHHSQIVRRSPVSADTDDAEFASRMAYALYLDRVNECLPVALGGGVLNAESAPFVTQLFPVKDGWNTSGPNFDLPFALDSDIEVPASIIAFGQKEIPVTPEVPGGWIPSRLVAPAPPPTRRRTLAEAFKKVIRAPNPGRISPRPVSQAPQTNIATQHALGAVPDEDAEDESNEPIPMVQGGLPPRGSAPSANAPMPGTSIQQLVNPLGNHHVIQPHLGGAANLGQPGMPHPNMVSPLEQPRASSTVQFQSQTSGSQQPLMTTTPMGGRNLWPSASHGYPDWLSPNPKRRRAQPTRVVPSPFGGNYQTVNSPQAWGTSNPSQSNPPQAIPTGYDQLQGMSQFGQLPIDTSQYLPASFIPSKQAARLKYTKVEQCTIHTADGRKKCPLQVRRMSFWFLYPVIGNEVFCTFGARWSTTDILEIEQPTAELGLKCLTGFDWNDSGTDACDFLVSFIRFRGNDNHGSFGRIGLPSNPEWSSVFDSGFLSRAYDSTMWNVDPNVGPSTAVSSKRFTILDFLPCLSQDYSGKYIPPHGITWREAQQLGMLIYFFYSALGTKPLNGTYNDEAFQTSVFGGALFRICTMIQNQGLEPIWRSHSLNCTAEYITALNELFHLFHTFVDHRHGCDLGNFGMDEGCFQSNRTNPILIVPADMPSGGFSSKSVPILNRVVEYSKRMESIWTKGRYSASYHPWKQHTESNWLQPASSTKSRQYDDSGLLKKKAGGEKDKSREKPKPVVPFQNSTPLFIWNPQADPLGSQDPTPALMPVVDRGKFPKIVRPSVDATDAGKTALYPICLNSSFEGHCRCKDIHECRAKGFRGKPGKLRLHIDLADSKWSADAYPEENWKPIVDFLSHSTYRKYVLPSEAFKKLTPSTTW